MVQIGDRVLSMRFGSEQLNNYNILVIESIGKQVYHYNLENGNLESIELEKDFGNRKKL